MLKFENIKVYVFVDSYASGAGGGYILDSGSVSVWEGLSTDRMKIDFSQFGQSIPEPVVSVYATETKRFNFNLTGTAYTTIQKDHGYVKVSCTPEFELKSSSGMKAGGRVTLDPGESFVLRVAWRAQVISDDPDDPHRPGGPGDFS